MLQKLVTAAAGAAMVAAAALMSPVMAQEWNMPTPYPDANFHTQNIKMFADEVAKATGGKLKITVIRRARCSSIPRSRMRCAAARCRSASS